MKKNQDIAYGIIGLGRFGSALARTLAEAGQEVIVLDKDEDKIKDMRQYTEYAFVTENLSQETLAETGIQNCDVVIVCIGEQVDVSILTTMRVIEMGIPFRSNTDSEVAAKLIGYFTQRAGRLRSGIAHTMRMLEGGYAMVLVRENALYAFRDPHGIRPLVLGRLGDDGWVVASETCALDIAGAKFVREIEPGEIVRVSDDGLRSERGCAPASRAECVFEHVYFSRPDSVKDGSSFYLVRHNMGRRLAQETPVEADLVISVPDSGTPAAEGFAQELGIPFGTGLIKNRYVARTFIQPTQELRQMGVRLKLNALPDVVRGKRLVMVDDSIVRGTTSRQIVRMLKEAGATEVHVRSASPMVRWPCFYGIDTGSQDQLIAASMSLDEIRSHIEADSVGFLSIEGLMACVPGGECHGYCRACFAGEYPVEIPRAYWGDRFLDGFEPNNLAPASATSQMPLKAACDFLDNDSKGNKPLLDR